MGPDPPVFLQIHFFKPFSWGFQGVRAPAAGTEPIWGTRCPFGWRREVDAEVRGKEKNLIPQIHVPLINAGTLPILTPADSGHARATIPSQHLPPAAQSLFFFSP